MSFKFTPKDAEIIFNYLFFITTDRLQIGFCPKNKKYCAIVDKHDKNLIGALEMTDNHVRCLLKTEVRKDYHLGLAPSQLTMKHFNLFIDIFIRKLGEETIKKYEENPNNSDFILIADKGKL